MRHLSEPKLVRIGPTSPNERLHHPQPPYPKHLNNPEKLAFGLILSKCTLTPECLIEHSYSTFHPGTEEEVSDRIERCTSASIPSSRHVFYTCVFHPIAPPSFTRLLINHVAIVTSKSGKVGKFTTANVDTSFPCAVFNAVTLRNRGGHINYYLPRSRGKYPFCAQEGKISQFGGRYLHWSRRKYSALYQG